ncbi:hypothetical protein SmJEL517_g02677 [Synchytrium microbalum]|uniref:Mannosyltransferase n=1 Tax=Synchytrium microbalum TaxID=1806994 RepID=A0A507C6G9_9FUNG|nr:uncharacterized protein SmJEL517_g02677 [Synchytrium microbalum]TPX34709.1 hypothetical protein SmJEL517_g02677 [Synchytrium microbalum]
MPKFRDRQKFQPHATISAWLPTRFKARTWIILSVLMVFLWFQLTPRHNEKPPRENGVILSLLRNEDLPELLETLKNFEERFNHRWHYPYLMLNNEEFSTEFMESVQSATESQVQFGLVEDFDFPDFINQTEAKEFMAKSTIEHGNETAYHHMCRWFSYPFINHELLAPYHWYWRLEPHVKFHCDIPYDPLAYMAKNHIRYGFAVVSRERPYTLPSILRATKNYLKKRNLVSTDLLDEFVFEEAADGSFEICQFYNNLEIVDLSLLRTRAYYEYFDYMDRLLGFYLERWGDAPIRTIYVAMTLPRSQIHHFADFGYEHQLQTSILCAGETCLCPKGPIKQSMDIGFMLPRTGEHSHCIERWANTSQLLNLHKKAPMPQLEKQGAKTNKMKAAAK